MKQSYPQLTDRLQSTFFDAIIIVLLMYGITSILDNFENVPDSVRIAMLLLVLSYEPICTSLGCTIGNYAKGIRVRKESNTAAKINIFQAFIRYIVKILLGWVSFLSINSNPKRRAMHDLASGSVMIKL
jgi:uncharacterized RDD family membrane protein YckC